MYESEIPKIEDIPKFRKMKNILRIAKVIRPVIFILSPFLKILGINTKEIREAIKQFTKLEKEFKELSTMPDKFNDIFAQRGWIIFEFLNLDAVKEALKIAETDIDKAEDFLVEYYTYEEVKRYLYMIHGVQAFRPRMKLAELALIDYKEGRYHACIPVILMLMDGLVNDLNPQNLGMSAENSDLTAWDSITAHKKGLDKLKEILFKTRKTTRTEELTVPYRHGILHGMDLGYANKMVAAKTWAALFAVRDWAAKVESRELIAPPPKPETTWGELSQQIQDNNEWKQSFDNQLENWKPRMIEVDKNIPKAGNIEDYEEGMPERKLIEFLTFWQKKNYGYMANCIWAYLQTSDKKMAGRVREAYSSCYLKSFELIEIIDEAPSVTEIKVLLNIEIDKKSLKKEVKFRLVINDGLDNKPLMRGMPNATWGVMNWGHGN
jgi:hypothetical protein